ncbi:small oligopeptide transporter [Daldinia caldariorum]|uniref:small oligopeptide transporter n=1 Tax=Daldinia caldariorum TaxID=326644 RepID=UPI0020089AA6|nr:small oligopeptide transporter [Daldinia caldariorum]KAI1464959.1 small oligopeptide transporter [Daldinia caldariorum]
MGRTHSSVPSGTANRDRMKEDDRNSEYGSDLDEISGEIRHRTRRSEERPHRTPGNGAASGVKHHDSEWTESSDRNDNDYEEGEEYEHLLDPNLPDEETIELHRLDSGSLASFDDENASKAGEENSPYEEVRAAVRNYDEDLPCNTLRAWTIGLTLVLIGASTNTLFSLRQPSIGLGPLIAQIIAWPLGRAWERVVPDRRIRIFGLGCDLNPGPFNIKEHSIIVVMASVSFSVAYATDIILAQLVFYKQNFGIIFQLVLTISTQSLGYGIAGMMRKFLVYPASMIWPGNLVAVALMNAMYEKHQAPDPSIIGGRMPRYTWFGLVTVASALYYLIPGYFAQFLSVFAFATWMAPQNPVVNQLFGGTTGLSLLPITFDWTQISGYIGSPLVFPWHAIANTTIGVVLFYIILATLFHYTGVWYAPFLPMSDSSTYDNTGARYNVSKILTPQVTLDEEAYKAYSPIFISTTFALSYGLSFAAITALIVYTYIHHSQAIWDRYKNSTSEKPDIHMKLMQKYKEAPSWWYFSLFVIVLALAFVSVLAYPTNLTWWAFLLAVGISFAFSLPIGIIQAVTNHQIGLNVLTEFVYGYIQPGRPLALMLFKTYGFITMAQALNFISDLKFGHYMKIPPRTMFMAQVVATTFSCFIQVAVLNFALNNIGGVCELTQPQRFTCPGGRVFFSASVIWGLIGPSRVFSPGQIYSGLLTFFVIGAAAPVIFWFAARRWPRSGAKYLMAPLIFGGAGSIPPATPLNYLSWGVVGYLFQHVIKKRHFRWWSRLNYLTSAGLDLGLALGTLVIFFVFTLNQIEAPRWWGNDVVTGTMDYQGEAIQVVLPPGETFGPKVW